MQLRLIPLLLATLLFATGCATYQAPRPVNDSTWLKNALSLTRNDLTVSVALPDDRQTEDHFGLPLQKGKVQPVWVRVTNPSSRAYWLLPAYTDPKYYSSAEVSHRFRRFLTSTETAQRQAMRIEELIFDTYIPPGSDQSGFIYTRYDEGSQVFSIALLSTGSLQRFDFLVPTARLRTDHLALSGSGKNGETRQVLGNNTDLSDLAHLRESLSRLPGTTTDPGGAAAGDPLNFFVIGPWNVLFTALISAGWDETELLDTYTALKTTQAFMFQTDYRHSPISPLYVAGRRQDAAFQKIRENIHARNHLRLWLTSMSYKGHSVWLGQISRDIGIRFTTRTPWLTTHEIDPDVDGARWSLVQDMILAQCVEKIGFVDGGFQAPPIAPRYNLTGDPYFTDGLRAVLFLSPTPVGADEIHILPWSHPPQGGLSQPGDCLKLFAPIR